MTTTTTMISRTKGVCIATKRSKTCLGFVSLMMTKTIAITITITRGIAGTIATYRSGATIAGGTFAMDATGATNFRPTTRYGCAIGAMPFIAAAVTKWISATIAARSCVGRVPHC